MRTALPSKLDPSSVVCVVDTREQLPLCLDPLQVEVGTLQTGDYGLRGCDEIRIERKSLPDLVACVGVERERFQREVKRLLAFRVRILLVESTWQEIELGQWRSKISVESVIGSLLGWAAMGIQLALVGTHERAGKFASRLLYTVANRRYRELRTFSQAMEQPEAPSEPIDAPTR